MHRVSHSLVRPWLVLAFIVACWASSFDCLGPARIVQAQIYKGSKIVPTPGTTAGRTTGTQMKNYFTVIGEVKYPETYELPTSAPSLIAFLKLAGGLQPGASGNIRIVRFTRSGQKSEEQHFYDERRTETLLPGDIVIVDSKIGNARIFNGPSQSLSDTDVYIGLVGILEYPFVMQTSAQNATISWVTQQLHQRPELAASAKVCLPGRSSSRVTPDTTLPNNSLIHFDNSKVVFSQLPEGLPRPFRPGLDQRPQVLAQLAPPRQPAPPAANSLPQQPATVASPEVRDQSVALDPEPVEPPAGRVRVSDPNFAAKVPGRKSVSEPKRLVPPTDANAVEPLEVSPEFQKPFRSEIDDETAANPSASPSETSELELSPIEESEVGKRTPSMAMQGAGSVAARPLAKPKQDGGLVPQPEPVAAAEPVDGDALNQSPEVVSEEAATKVASNTLNWKTIAAVVTGGIGLFSMCWVLLTGLKSQPAQNQMLFAEPKHVRPLLDRLINNELPIHIEDVRLDPALRIHGRPRDIGQQRLDRPQQAVARPHFMNRKPQTQPSAFSGTHDAADHGREVPTSQANRPQRDHGERLNRATAAERRTVSRRPASEEKEVVPAGFDASVMRPARSGSASSTASRLAVATPMDSQSESDHSSRDASESSVTTATQRPKFRFDKTSVEAVTKTIASSRSGRESLSSGCPETSEFAQRTELSRVQLPVNLQSQIDSDVEHQSERPTSSKASSRVDVSETEPAKSARSIPGPHAVVRKPTANVTSSANVKPSRVIAEGSDIVDRALAAFERGE